LKKYKDKNKNKIILMMYTHIMNVQIWSIQYNKVINDEILLNEIKNNIVEKELIEHIPINNQFDMEMKLKWRIAKWMHPYDILISGNLITDAIEYDTDNLIYLHTQRIIEGIENHLKDNHFGNMDPSSWKIIFYLSKPLSSVTPIQSTL
jgi:hypothetical protein